jgi:RHS repeat-associated protein
LTTNSTSQLPHSFHTIYDDVGNRTSSHLSTSYGYQQGAFNRLTATQQATYTFDANGNVTSKSEGTNKWYYSYDYENRLTNATKFGGLMPRAGESINYHYDALGRRVIRQDKKTGRTEFTHDGLDVIQDRKLYGDSTTTTNYVNGLGIDDKLKVTSGTTSKYFLTDHLGSTVGLTDSNGVVTETASYDSFGRVIASNLSTRYQYTGRESDEKSGLMYYRARQYDPQIGRFTTEDPIGFAAGDVNLYAYVDNNPINNFDSLGLEVEAVFDMKKGTLTVRDVQTGERLNFNNVFSGDGECKNNSSCERDKNKGPVPRGRYLLGTAFKKISNQPVWYPLYGKDNQGRWTHGDVDTPSGRGGFFLHLGGFSLGCITISKDGLGNPDQYDKLVKLLNKTQRLNIKNSKGVNQQYTGYLTVR